MFALPIEVPVDGGTLPGDLTIPSGATGVVVFAHGSGSSRKSPRNVMVAEVLQGRGLATLLFDLLTPDEERLDARTAHLRFDIPLLAWRLIGAIDGLPELGVGGMPVGCFGASTGAAAALTAAARRANMVRTVVSRGGRPDLAGDELEAVRAPTLLIVGERDEVVIDLNREAMRRMRYEVELVIVPGATHLFEEPGALDRVASLAGDWFAGHLGQER
jgi:putative phosphoribosyl transferase